ncbi:hypothetical protein B0I35DRAFT_38947 [Stachybotrys elegans]|uniref:Uncharacterized protein n=1 Tax=Stachybotrys elegans TaxID=80388 RepID=A0A8K0T2X8_9HYPO|nr:hypothetical protein B0I35DRAFT_38947 [Stachybotrys elegans]
MGWCYTGLLSSIDGTAEGRRMVVQGQVLFDGIWRSHTPLDGRAISVKLVKMLLEVGRHAASMMRNVIKNYQELGINGQSLGIWSGDVILPLRRCLPCSLGFSGYNCLLTLECIRNILTNILQWEGGIVIESTTEGKREVSNGALHSRKSILQRISLHRFLASSTMLRVAFLSTMRFKHFATENKVSIFFLLSSRRFQSPPMASQSIH